MYLKIGSKKYSVRISFSHADFERELAERGCDDVRTARSFVSYEESLIVVRPGMSHDVQRERIVHEAIHAAVEDSGLIEHDEENTRSIETVVSALAPRLVSLVIDNPGLWA